MNGKIILCNGHLHCKWCVAVTVAGGDLWTPRLTVSARHSRKKSNSRRYEWFLHIMGINYYQIVLNDLYYFFIFTPAMRDACVRNIANKKLYIYNSIAMKIELFICGVGFREFFGRSPPPLWSAWSNDQMSNVRGDRGLAAEEYFRTKYYLENLFTCGRTTAASALVLAQSAREFVFTILELQTHSYIELPCSINTR